MFDSSRDLEILNKAIRISKLPDKFRTAQELGILSSVLSKFDLFQTKVAQEQLPDVLRAAALNVKFVKVPMGQFLYHKDEPSQCIYFILKGEAWKFRPKTENELKIDSKVVKEKQSHPQKAVPKMLETVKLAKALQERTIMSEKQTLSVNVVETTKSQGSVSTIPQAARSLVTLPSFVNSRAQVLDKIVDNPSLENSINTSFNELENGEKEKDGERIGSECDTPNQRINFNAIIKKIMSKRDLLNFENDYFYNVIKRNEDLSSKYIKDNLNVMRFERKVCPGETVGELSMSLNCARTSSLLAYSNLYVLYLDQKGYENTFMNQIEEVRDKVQYFVNYFRDMKPDILRRICFFFKEQKFKIGDIIYKEDSPCDDLFFIKSGEVQLIKKVETEENLIVGYEKNRGSLIAFNSEGRNKNKQKSVIVASIVEGYFFGEEALFDNSNRNFTAKSVSNLVCYKIASKILEKLPKDTLQKLRDFAVSKQTWRGKRIKDITNKSIALTISVNPSSLNLETLATNEDDSRVPITTTTTNTQKKFKERQGIKKLSTLERSLEKLVSPKKREVQTRQAAHLSESDSQYRFKLKSRMNKEDHNPYVLKLLPKDESMNKKKPLSLWKQNIALLRERPAISLSKTTLDQRSISRSKEDYLETLPNLKSTLSIHNSIRGSTAKDIISRTLQTQKNSNNNHQNTKSTPTLKNLVLEKGNDDLRHYLMKNLHQKFVKEFSQKNYQLTFDSNFDTEPTTVMTVKRGGLEDTMQSTIREKPQDTMMCTLSDFRGKGSSRPGTKKISLRDQKMKNQFYIKSLTTLDTSTQISSLKEVPTTMKSMSQDEDKPFFTTNIQESSLLGKKMTLKIRS